jgi:hypothetical protein
MERTVAEVVSFRGGAVPQTNPDPDPEVVDYLKSLPEMAESGDLQGLAGISTHLGERFSVHRVGRASAPRSLENWSF